MTTEALTTALEGTHDTQKAIVEAIVTTKKTAAKNTS
jgi:hypothetical protein